MSEKRELAISPSKQYDSTNTKETVVQASTEKGNKEQDSTFSHPSCRTEYAFTQQNKNTNKCRYFRNLNDFASNGQFLTEQKQHMRNVSVEFKTGLEHLVKRRIVFREYKFNNGIFHVYITETSLNQIAVKERNFFREA